MTMTSEQTKTCYIIFSKELSFAKESMAIAALRSDMCPIIPEMSLTLFVSFYSSLEQKKNYRTKLFELSDELWVFGTIDDGMIAKIREAHEANKPVKFFDFADKEHIYPHALEKSDIAFDENLTHRYEHDELMRMIS